MSELPETRNSLLVRLVDPSDQEAWDLFSDLYRPAIYRLARGRGLQHADAQDLVQQVLMSVTSAIPRWEQKNPKTRFRHWIRRVTKNAAINALSRHPKDRASGDTALMALLNGLPARNQPMEHAIELEYRREVYRRAAEELRAEIQPRTWDAFTRTMIQGEPIETVSMDLGMSVGSIYVARCRIMSRLREIVRRIEEELDT